MPGELDWIEAVNELARWLDCPTSVLVEEGIARVADRYGWPRVLPARISPRRRHRRPRVIDRPVYG